MKMSRLVRRCAVAAVAIVVAGLTAATPSAAADSSFDFPAGTACAFAFRLDVADAGRHAVRVSNNNRVISAGAGSTLTFVNVATGKTVTLKSSSGSVEIATLNADGTTTLTGLGHTVVFLFPTDTPQGPSTTLYVGSVVAKVDAGGNFTILRHSGTTTDICAALS
jgi:hypothetical protein